MWWIQDFLGPSTQICAIFSKSCLKLEKFETHNTRLTIPPRFTFSRAHLNIFFDGLFVLEPMFQFVHGK